MVILFSMYFEQLTTPTIYGLGDTHDLGICRRIIEKYDLTDCVLIGVGDHGEGFGQNPIERDAPVLFNLLNPTLVERNIKFLVIRGNHSNPDYFIPDHYFNTNLSNIEFVQDYSYKTINDKAFLFVGGATSIDRQTRTSGIDYWKNEEFVLPSDLSTLKPVDVLITHSTATECPPYGFANITGWFTDDPTLKNELITERQNISKLIEHVNCSQVYFGHFHQTISERIDNIFYRGLDINEVISISNYLQ